MAGVSFVHRAQNKELQILTVRDKSYQRKQLSTTPFRARNRPRYRTDEFVDQA
jgi:hypothetical protein